MKRILEGLFMIGMIAVMAGFLIVPAMAAEEGSSEGSFTLANSAPTIGEHGLYDTDREGTISTMTPFTEYSLKISVTDLNSLNDLTEIEVKINSNGYSAGDSPSDQMTFSWTSSGGWGMEGTSTTWSVDNTEGTYFSSEPNPLTDASGDFWLHFIPGKVARAGAWDYTITVTDSQGPVVVTAPSTATMSKYVELTANDGAFSFPAALGSTVSISSPVDSNIDILTIANDNFQLDSKSGNWMSGENSATLDWDGTLTSNHFQLDVDNANDMVGKNIVSDAYLTITGYSTVTGPTLETGDVKEIYGQLTLPDDGFIAGEYTGNLYIQIV
jgi:hypothetical protein